MFHKFYNSPLMPLLVIAILILLIVLLPQGRCFFFTLFGYCWYKALDGLIKDGTVKLL